jgi:hypothetical protein
MTDLERRRQPRRMIIAGAVVFVMIVAGATLGRLVRTDPPRKLTPDREAVVAPLFEALQRTGLKVHVEPASTRSSPSPR